jgi:hypothetical protein
MEIAVASHPLLGACMEYVQDPFDHREQKAGLNPSFSV